MTEHPNDGLMRRARAAGVLPAEQARRELFGGGHVEVVSVPFDWADECPEMLGERPEFTPDGIMDTLS